MRGKISMLILVAAAFATPSLFVGCEEAHSETTKNNLFGGQTHEETTVIKNPVTGSTSVENEKQVTH